jgi:serine/threonine protein kinase
VLYLATQYVTGGDLGSYVRARGLLPVGVALDVFAQILEGLRDAHASGVIHRDVKPANILLRGDRAEPWIYLCDFGIAQAGGDSRTKTGIVAGSMAYMAPERHHGQPATVQSDLYAAGCVLLVMLTGRVPYEGTDFQQAMGHISGEIPQLTGIDLMTDGVNRLLAWCLAKNPDDRPHTAELLLQEVHQLEADLAVLGDQTMLRSPAFDTSQTLLAPARVPAPVYTGQNTATARLSPTGRHCIQCGAPLSAGSIFCTACGATTQLGSQQVPSRQKPVIAITLAAITVVALIAVGIWVMTKPSEQIIATPSPSQTSATESSEPSSTGHPSSPAIPESELIVYEDFSSGRIPDGWETEAGSWKIVDGRLQATTKDARSRISFGTHAPENYKIECLVRFVKVKDASRWLNIGLDYHTYEDFGAVLVLRSGTVAHNGIELAQKSGPGKSQKYISFPIGAATAALGVGKDHWVMIEVHGSNLDVSIDGQYVFSANNLARIGGGLV